MFEINTTPKIERTEFHYDIICDETGILDGFNYIIECISEKMNVRINLFYLISNNYSKPIFQKELSIIERRYPGTLNVHIISLESKMFWSKWEIFNAISNTSTKKFLVYGTREFINNIFEMLTILDVKASKIKLKLVKDFKKSVFEEDTEIFYLNN